MIFSISVPDPEPLVAQAMQARRISKSDRPKADLALFREGYLLNNFPSLS